MPPCVVLVSGRREVNTGHVSRRVNMDLPTASPAGGKHSILGINTAIAGATSSCEDHKTIAELLTPNCWIQ